MISITEAYAIVDEKDNILLFTLSSNRPAAWRSLLAERMQLPRNRTRQEWQKLGFKCVPVEIKTKEYRR